MTGFILLIACLFTIIHCNIKNKAQKNNISNTTMFETLHENLIELKNSTHIVIKKNEEKLIKIHFNTITHSNIDIKNVCYHSLPRTVSLPVVSVMLVTNQTGTIPECIKPVLKYMRMKQDNGTNIVYDVHTRVRSSVILYNCKHNIKTICVFNGVHAHKINKFLLFFILLIIVGSVIGMVYYKKKSRNEISPILFHYMNEPESKPKQKHFYRDYQAPGLHMEYKRQNLELM